MANTKASPNPVSPDRKASGSSASSIFGFLQIKNCFIVRLRAKLSAPPTTARPLVVFFNTPDLIALHRIYTIALYINYPVQSYYFYL